MASNTVSLIDKIKLAKAIRLEIPDDSPRGQCWAPSQFEPSVILGRVDHIQCPTLPQVQVTGTRYDLSLRLTERIGYNSFLDIYYASVGIGAEYTTGLVAKVVDLSTYPVKGAPSRSGVEEDVAEQVEIFNYLESLQGEVIPRFGGLFSSGKLYCLVYEDAGKLLTREERVDPAVGDQIVEAVKAIQALNVDACFYDWKLVCLDHNGRIKFTDARLMGMPEDVEIKEKWANTPPAARKAPDLETFIERTRKRQFARSMRKTEEMVGR